MHHLAPCRRSLPPGGLDIIVTAVKEVTHYNFFFYMYFFCTQRFPNQASVMRFNSDKKIEPTTESSYLTPVSQVLHQVDSVYYNHHIVVFIRPAAYH